MSAYSDRVLLDGAAFYWRLGESAGTTAIDQKGILNGTHLGAVSIAQPGALGGSGDTDKSVSYAATGRTEVAADPRHQSFSNWTLELWAYPTGGGYLAIAGHGYVGAGYMPYVIGLDQTTGYIPTAGFFNGSSWQRVQDSVQVTLNTWVHLVATFDGTTIRLYRNGVLVASGPGTGWTAAPAAAPFRIGERWDEGQFFPGRVDEVALYPTALNATQIQAHFKAAGPTSPYANLVWADGPRAYWRLGESALPVVDSSGNGIDFGAGNVGGTLVYAQSSLLLSDPANKSIYFNTGWLSRGTAAPLDVRDVFTFEAWVKLPTLSHGDMCIFSNSSQYLRIGSNNTLQLLAQGAQLICQSTVGITDLNTHHVVATKNGATVKLYIDGVDVTGTVSNWTFANAPNWLTLGTQTTGGESANMVMDEIVLYPVALSQAQVLAHYNAGVAAPPPPQIVQVPGVFPPGYQVSIVGQVIVSDGHLVGWKAGALFGVPTILGAAPATSVGGVPSAQQFGAVTTRIGTPTSLTVGGVPSAQQFGALTFFFPPQVKPVSGVPSAQQFGQVKANQRQQVGTVPSAAAFGTSKVAQRYELIGLGTAQQFGAVKAIPGPVFRQVQGVPSAQLFGHVTPHRYDLHVTCKPEGGLTMPPSTTGGFVLTPITTGTFTLTPNVDSPFVLTPIEEGDFVLAAVDEDG